MKFIYGVIGIVLISATPALFGGASFLDFRSYLTALQQVFAAFFTPAEWTLHYQNPLSFETWPVSFSEFLSGPYLYSMPILFMALALAFILAFILSFIVLLTDGAIKGFLLRTAKIIESFPDFAYIFLIQIAVLFFFQKTGILLLSFYSLGDDRIYLAPVLCLAVLPALLFFKLFILLYEQEQQRSYIELARSKGLSQFDILWKHCTSNVLQSVFYQSKSIVWLTLSTLLIVEYLFGLNGILYYLRSDFSPKGITFILLSIFIPFFLIYTVIELVLLRKFEIERNAVFEKFNLRLFDFQEIRSSIRSLFSINKMQMLRSRFIRKPKILLPALLVAGLLLTSLLYAAVTGDHIAQTQYLYGQDGGIDSSAPHAPSAQVVFGTDPYGYSIAQQLLVGMKSTIILSLLIAGLRIFFGYLFGILYTFFFTRRIRQAVNSIADGMHFLPLTLLTFILLIPVLIGRGEWDTTLTERLIYQVLIMSLVVLPVTTSAIGNEMNETLKKEYVISSVLMGGSMSWILAKHIQPALWPKLALMWVQHIVQVLQMFVHLGILSVFVGGALSQSDSPRLVPEIYELSGMIAISREVFATNQYWMIIPPLAVFMILIYCFSAIADGLIQKQAPPLPVQKAEKAPEPHSLSSSFTRINNPKISEDAN
ncbi:hypothetical protein [Planococcus sp. ISL-109]|uniref:hypothetical protein n=1 Tax=Planococcus sp. ISL-109 TaxID=2819166 RepID=UPI001BE9C7F0|nr:hypothetical protein [Planococcus sp. ISL-109]MBT2581276.1 hypothetical protein [Planococcus sp. ISL-109]